MPRLLPTELLVSCWWLKRECAVPCQRMTVSVTVHFAGIKKMVSVPVVAQKGMCWVVDNSLGIQITVAVYPIAAYDPPHPRADLYVV